LINTELSSNTTQISVVVPMRNAGKYIAKTLKNILEQQQVTLEIIVIDDKSTDNSAAIVKSFNDPRIKLLNGPGVGIAAALNLGYSAANGELIVRCDADDFLCPNDRLIKQYLFLNNNHDYDAVCGNFLAMDSYDNHLGSFSCGDTQRDITNNIKNGELSSSFCTYAIKRTLFNKVGGFRPYFVTAEDLDFQLRLSEHTNVMYFPDDCYIYRLHGDSITHLQPENTKHAYEAIAKTFQQQRRIAGKDDLELGLAKPVSKKNDASKPTSARVHAMSIAVGNSWRLHSQGQKKSAIALIFTLFKKNPLSFTLMKHMILLAIKPVNHIKNTNAK
jgi:glycosyltransferase involved in cell wall biosynthesis